MHRFQGSKAGNSLVLGTLMLVIVTLIAGVLFYTFVLGNVQFMTETLNTQTSLLTLDSVNINATHIAAFIRNSGKSVIEIMNAYVNQELAALAKPAKVEATATAPVFIRGAYMKGLAYSVKLAGMFGTLITFKVTF